MHAASQRTPRSAAYRQPRALLSALAALLVALSLLTPFTAASAPTAPTPHDLTPAEERAFQRTWARTDQPVADGSVAHTWMWGPAPLGEPVQEPYAEAPGGQRTVVYYDKSRMEITDPDAVDDGQWYVTNGLLVQEMVSGEVQTGGEQWEPRLPPEINIVGDQGFENGPTYASLTGFTAPTSAVGDSVTSVMDAHGRVLGSNINERYNVRIAALSYTGTLLISHGIPTPFWEFMNASGPVMLDGELVEGRLFENPYYATGLPLTEPFWTRVVVGGTEKDVLFQCFQRRCLTYTPDNPTGWQVESGNVGQHYQQWSTVQPPDIDGELLIAKPRPNGSMMTPPGLFLINADGSNERQLIPDFRGHITERLWSPDGMYVAFVSGGDIYLIDVQRNELKPLTQTSLPQEGAIAWAPDSKQLVFTRWGTEQSGQLFTLSLSTGTETKITGLTPETQLEASDSPTWSPDGEWIAYTNRQPGTFGDRILMTRPDGSQTRELMPASGPDITDLAWTADRSTVVFHMPVTTGRDASGGSLWSVDAAMGVVSLELLAGCSTIGRGCANGGTSYAPTPGVPAPNGNLVALTVAPAYDAPVSPDHGTLGVEGLSIIDLTTGEIDQLLHTGGGPSWSSDGEYLAFSHYRKSRFHEGASGGTAIISRDGSVAWLIPTHGGGPQWRPVVTTP